MMMRLMTKLNDNYFFRFGGLYGGGLGGGGYGLGGGLGGYPLYG